MFLKPAHSDMENGIKKVQMSHEKQNMSPCPFSEEFPAPFATHVSIICNRGTCFPHKHPYEHPYKHVHKHRYEPP